jgi:glucose/mannose-6-phosphate isomerase
MERNCSIIALTTGGTLAKEAKKADYEVWQFQHPGQPRAAVGYSFTLLLALFSRLGLISTSDTDVNTLITGMKLQQAYLMANVPLPKNPAKRLAGQLMGHFVTVFGAEHMAPVARRWKTQMNELAKNWSSFEVLPEADHNAAAGTITPPDLLVKLFGLFIESPTYHPRNRLRSELTRIMLMENGINVDRYIPIGETTLTQIWTALHFGDYVAFYLALSYQVDPTEISALEHLKKTLESHK